MQRRRHVDAFVVVVGAFEADVLRTCVRADAPQKIGKRRAAPAADRAPPFHADMPRDLLGMRQRVQLGQGPDALTGDEAADLQLVVGSVDIGDVFDTVERVEREGSRDLCFGVGRRELLRIEQGGLRAVIQARHGRQECVDRIVVGERAAGQHRQAAERQKPLAEQASRRHREFAPGVDQDRFAVELIVEHRGGLSIGLSSGLGHDSMSLSFASRCVHVRV